MSKERLDSWKSIAEYLERSLRTVQRWHLHHGLPVHRFGGAKGAVFAYPEEIDRWLVSLAQETQTPPVSEEQALERRRAASAEMAQAADQMWASRSERNIQTVTALYRKAIDHDPTNDAALVGLANAMLFSALYGLLDGAVAYPSAADALRRLSLEAAEAPQARCASAWLSLLHERDWRRARAVFDELCRTASCCAFATAGLALLHMAEENSAQACELVWKAWRGQPSAASLGTLLCWVHAMAGDTQQAQELVEQVKMSGSAYHMATAVEGYVLLCSAEPELAMVRLEEIAAQNRTYLPVQAMLGYLYARSGQTTGALEILYSFERLSQMKRRSHGYDMALLHLGLGDSGAALSCLETAYEAGSPWSLFYRCDPLLEPLRGEERFANLLQRAGAQTEGNIAALD